MNETQGIRAIFILLCCAAIAVWMGAACSPDRTDGDGDADGDSDGDGDGDSDGDSDGDGDGDPPFTCTPGVQGCWDNAHYECGTDGASRINVVECPEACDPNLGCVM